MITTDANPTLIERLEVEREIGVVMYVEHGSTAGFVFRDSTDENGDEHTPL